MRFKVGQKVALLGGGNLGNTFHVVKLLKIKRIRKRFGNVVYTKQAVVETGDNLPNPMEPYITDTAEGLPLGGSTWSLGKLPKEIQDLPLGHYAVCGNEIRDISHIGLFGSIFNAKVVKVLKRPD